MKLEQKPDFDAGLPSIEETLTKIKEIAASQPPWSEEEARAAGFEGVSREPAQQEAEPASVPDLPAAKAESPPETVEKPTVSAGLRRLLEKEAAIIERETALKAREAVATPPSPAPVAEPSLAQLRALYKRDKIAALKALDANFNPGATAKQLWYHDLGDLAPKEARAELQAGSAMGSVEALQMELEETKREVLQQIEQHKAELAYQQYVTATQTFTGSIPESLPLVKKFTAKKPDKVVEALIGVARKHAQATNGQVLTPQQAAAKLEASLKELQLTEGVAPAPTTPSETGGRGINTLRNKHTSVQPSRATEDELDDDKLRERAMAELDKAKKQSARLFPQG